MSAFKAHGYMYTCVTRVLRTRGELIYIIRYIYKIVVEMNKRNFSKITISIAHIYLRFPLGASILSICLMKFSPHKKWWKIFWFLINIQKNLYRKLLSIPT